MADEPTAAPQASKPKRSSRLVPAIIVIFLMGIEGVGVFMLAKALGPEPTQAYGASSNGPGGEEGEQGADGFSEIEIAECRPSNRMGGTFVTFHIRVSALVAAEDLERTEKLVRAKRARLEDGINAVIRRAAPKHLSEPGFQTLKRSLRQEFGRIFGDEELVKDVLIPQWLQSKPGV